MTIAAAGAAEMISGPPVLLDHWRDWTGAIACAHTGRIWPAQELRALATEAAASFTAGGIEPGDAVILMLGNTAAFPVGLIGLLEIGCNPLLTFAATPLPALERLVAEFGVRHIVHDFIDGLGALPDRAYPEIGRITVGPMAISVLVNTDAEPATSKVLARGIIFHPTSGTYGAAKFCARNQTAAIAEARNYITTVDVYRSIRVTVTTPLTHAFAYGFGLVSSILTDSVLALDIAFNPKRILRLEQENRSDILAIVPPMARALTKIARGDPGVAMAKTVFYAGAPIDSSVVEAFEQTFGVSIFAILGSTETGGITTSYTRGNQQSGVGCALHDVSIGIANQDRYQELGDGVGELRVRSTSMMQGYLPALAPVHPSDYFPTGDIGFVDGDGALTLVGRTRDIINIGGMKVDPSEVEAVLLAHPMVDDAATYLGLREDGTEFVQAAIVGEKTGIDSVRAHCVDQLDRHKVPTAIHIVTEIPRTPSGKILKGNCPGYPKQTLGRRSDV